MLVHSQLLGQVDIDEHSVLTLAAPLAGLEDCTRFKLFHDEGTDDTSRHVYWMQSLDNPAVTFSLTDPACCGIRYERDLENERDALQRERAEDAVVLVMVYKDVQQATHPALAPLKANLSAPLVINTASRRALQLPGLIVDVCMRRVG